MAILWNNLLILLIGVWKFRLFSKMTENVPFFCIFPSNQRNITTEVSGGAILSVIRTTMQDISKFITSFIGHCFHLQSVISPFCFFENFIMLAWRRVPSSVQWTCHSLISVTTQHDNASLYHSSWAFGNSVVVRCCCNPYASGELSGL